MQRRDFLKKASIATAGAFVAPYILPSGRLFAKTGSRSVDHVVFCMFAGGVRNLESVQKMQGNLLPSILTGTESINSVISPSMDPLPVSPLPMQLQKYGTLFKDFRYAQGPTGHYNGHTTAITGRYTNSNIDIKAHPDYPTIFEYYRKHNSPSQTALNCWWVSDSLGPYPALNYSKYEGYGPMYGANFIAPNFLITEDGINELGNMRDFSQSESKVSSLRNFFDNHFKGITVNGDPGIVNTSADNKSIQTFIKGIYANPGALNNPWAIPGDKMNGDMYNIYYAEKILEQYKPELLVVNMQGVDVCHTDFTQYCNNLRKADWAVAHLWNTIQSTPGLANNTVMIIAPEHGRNLKGNSIVDQHGMAAIDHTGDDTSREIFCLVVGPPSVVNQNKVVANSQPQGEGESIEIVPTIANLLGFDAEIPGGILKSYNDCALQQAFI